MKKILMLMVMIGLFYGCAFREASENVSMLESLESFEESYKEGKIKRLLGPNHEELVDLGEFFALSKEERKIRAKEIEKDLKRSRKIFLGQAGITLNEEDSNEVKSKKLTNQVLELFEKSLPTPMRKAMFGTKKLDKRTKEMKRLIKKEDINGVEKLLKNGFDVNMVIDTFYKHTIIYDAIKTENLELVKTIVKNGAKLNIEDVNHNTPIVYAAKLENKSIVEYLLDQKINILEENSLLHEILVFNDFKLIDKCLAKGLDINIQNAEGNTPLIMAIYNRANLKTIKYLIKKGANLDVISTDNKNILEIAKINNREEIYNYLKTIYKPKKNSHLLNNEQSKIFQIIHSKHNYPIINESQILGRSFSIEHVAITENEKKFITVDYMGVIRVFNLKDGKLIRKFGGGNKDIIFLKLIDNDKKLITSSILEIQIWDLNSGQIIHNFKEQSIEGEIELDKQMEEVRKMHKNNKKSAIYETITNIGNTVMSKALQEQFGIVDKKNIHIYDIDITPDNQKIIVSKTNGNINIWDIKKGKIIKVIEDKKAMHITAIDNNRIIYSNKDNIVNILNIDTNNENKIIDSKNHKIKKFYKLGKYVFIDNSSIYLRVLNLETNKEEAGFFFYASITDIVMADNKKVIFGTFDGKIYQGDMLSLPKRKNKVLSHDMKMIGYHNTRINDLIILPKSKNLLSIDAYAIKLWKL